MTAIRMTLSALVATGALLLAAPGIAQNPKQAGAEFESHPVLRQKRQRQRRA